MQDNVRFPAEWEPQAAILIAWPHAGTDWADVWFQRRTAPASASVPMPGVGEQVSE